MVAYSFKLRFAEPILAGLGEQRMHRVAPKRQTIRAVGKRRHARPGETLQLYTGMRTRQCKKIGEARCVSVEPIVIGVTKRGLKILRFKPDPIGLEAFARADGFASLAEMHEFWKQEHGLGKFSGVLIKWEEIR